MCISLSIPKAPISRWLWIWLPLAVALTTACSADDKVDLKFAEESELMGPKPHARVIGTTVLLPKLGESKVLSAAVFEPFGHRDSAGVEFRWPLPKPRKPGESLWLLTVNKKTGKWMAAPQQAHVSDDGLAAVGTVELLTLYALVDRLPDAGQLTEWQDDADGQVRRGFTTGVREFEIDDREGIRLIREIGKEQPDSEESPSPTRKTATQEPGPAELRLPKPPVAKPPEIDEFNDIPPPPTKLVEPDGFSPPPLDLPPVEPLPPSPQRLEPPSHSPPLELSPVDPPTTDPAANDAEANVPRVDWRDQIPLTQEQLDFYGGRRVRKITLTSGERIRFAWLPHKKIAVHFPFQVTAPPGERVRFAVDVKHRGHRIAERHFLQSDRPDFDAWGLARLGAADFGSRPAFLSVFDGFSSRFSEPADVTEAFQRQANRTTMLEDGLPIAFRAWHTPELNNAMIDRDGHIAFHSEDEAGVFGAILSADAPRGWYSFWMVVDPRSLWKLAVPEAKSQVTSAEIDLVARMFEVRLDRSVSPYEYAFAQGAQLDPPLDPRRAELLRTNFDATKWRRMPDVITTVKLRRNDWVFEKSEARVSRDYTTGPFATRRVSVSAGGVSVRAWIEESNATVVADLLTDRPEKIIPPGGEQWRRTAYTARFPAKVSGFERAAIPMTVDLPLIEYDGEKSVETGRELQSRVVRESISREPDGRMGRVSASVFAGYYTPLSEMISNTSGRVSPPDEEDVEKKKYDGFWEWFTDSFLPENERSAQAIDEALTVASALGIDSATLRRRISILAGAIQSDSAAASPDLKVRQKQLLVQAEANLAENAKLLEQRIAAAQETAVAMLDAIGRQQQRTKAAGTKREQIEFWQRSWEDRHRLIAARMYASAGDMERFSQAMPDPDTELLSSEFRLEMGRMFLEAGQYVKALSSCRRALVIDPSNAAAAALTASIERSMLNVLARKVDGEVARARGHFNQYLAGRGISLNDNDSDGLFATLWTGSALGPGTALANRAVGLVNARGNESATIQEVATLKYAGVQAMIALVERDIPLERIYAGLTSEQLHSVLKLRRATGQEYEPRDYATMGAAIKLAAQLDEIWALIYEDEVTLRTALKESSFDFLDLDVSEVMPLAFGADTVETIGDVTSARNMFLTFLPSSVGAVGGKMAGVRYWGVTGSRARRALEASRAAGIEVRTGQEVVARWLGWERAMASLGRGQRGARLLTYLDRSYRYRTTGNVLWTGSWKVGKFVAGLGILNGTVQLADQIGGSDLAFVAEALFSTFIYDPDLCMTLLQRGRVQPQTVRSVIRKYGREVERLRVRAEMARVSAVPGLDNVALRDANLNPRELLKRYVEARDSLEHYLDLEAVFKNWMPADDLVVCQEYAIYEALAAAQRGSAEETRRAALAAYRLTEQVKQQMDEFDGRLIKLEELAKRLPRDEVAGIVDQQVVLDLGMETRANSHLTRAISEGDRARLAGNLDKAIAEYQAAIMEFNITPGDLKRGRQIYEKLKFTKALREARRGYQRPPSVRQPRIPEEIAGTALAAADDSNLLPVASQHWVHRVTVHGRPYAVKRFKPTGRTGQSFTVGQLERAAYAELIAAELADLFGCNVPPVSIRRVPPSGKLQYFEMVRPWLGGQPLDLLSGPHVVAIKDQFADHKVFSLILGDSDRKLDNYMLDAEGRLWALDAGSGVLDSWVPIPSVMTTQERYAQFCLDDRLERTYRRVHQGNAEPWEFNQLMLEESLTRQDLLPAMERAESMFRDPARRREIFARIERKLASVVQDPVELKARTNGAMNVMLKRVNSLKKLQVNKGTVPLHDRAQPVRRNNFPE